MYLEKSENYPALVNFKASESFVSKLCKSNIISKKITKVLSAKELANVTNGVKKITIDNFMAEVKILTDEYHHSRVWNTDQVGFNYEFVAKRTLEEISTRKSEVVVSSKTKQRIVFRSNSLSQQMEF